MTDARKVDISPARGLSLLTSSVSIQGNTAVGEMRAIYTWRVACVGVVKGAVCLRIM